MNKYYWHKQGSFQIGGGVLRRELPKFYYNISKFTQNKLKTSRSILKTMELEQSIKTVQGVPPIESPRTYFTPHSIYIPYVQGSCHAISGTTEDLPPWAACCWQDPCR